MGADLWSLAQSRRDDHVFSTLFTASSIGEHLGAPAGIDAAIAWCRQTAVTRVYLESFRGGLLAAEEQLREAKESFLAAGFEVSGCVTTTGMVDTAAKGKQYFPCFTHAATQQQLESIFTYTASLFDEIMIDDFYCTACECDECRQARGEGSWAEYRLALMNALSAERVLGPARRANPRVRIIIKYPMWYEVFQERGYDADLETRAFDRTWVGTEIRDFGDPQWGGVSPYRAYWLMRWLGQIGGEKCGGGWYDPYGTHAETYLEQARQTILGGARESVLFCYPSLLRDTGPGNVEALRREQPALLDLAAWVRNETPRGVACYKPISSPGGDDAWIADWLGLAGVPLLPCHRFPEAVPRDGSAPPAIFPVQAASDPAFGAKLRALLGGGGRALLTRAAARAAGLDSTATGTFVLPAERPERIPELPADQLAALREVALTPFGLSLEGPTWVSLYLFGSRKLALESFRDEPVEMRLTLPDVDHCRLALTLGREGAALAAAGGTLTVSLPPRTLVCLERSPGRGGVWT